MKIKVQAQHLQPGDIVGSGEVIDDVTLNSTKWPSNKVQVLLSQANKDYKRAAYWGKYTMINVKRAEANAN